MVSINKGCDFYAGKPTVYYRTKQIWSFYLGVTYTSNMINNWLRSWHHPHAIPSASSPIEANGTSTFNYLLQKTFRPEKNVLAVILLF